MYFNEKNNTNIDKDFNKEKKFNLKEILNKYKLFIIIGIIILIIILVILLIPKKEDITYYLILEGSEEITLYKDSTYIEPGYNAYDNNKNDLTDQVNITNNLDTSIIGDYTITYSIEDIMETRIIHIIEKPIGATYIHLKGDDIIYLNIDETYNEPGCVVIDTVDSNLTNKVIINDNIDSSKAGIYEVTYTVTNSSGVTTSAKRKVIVIDSEITLSLDNTNYTNQDVNIKININDNYFSYFTTPDSKKITEKEYSYKVSDNGTYKFTIYNNKGTSSTKEITVSNIDKEKPTGTCSGYILDGKSYVTVNANDNVGISKYVANGVSSSFNVITLNNEVSSPSVIIYDKAGNSTNINCTLEKKSSSSNENRVNLTVASWNIGSGCKNGCKIGKKYGDKIADEGISLIGLQEADPQNESKQGSIKTFTKNISSNSNLNYYYYNSKIWTNSRNTTLSKYAIVSSEEYKLTKCGSEQRVLVKVVVNVNGIDISFYNTHVATNKSCQTKQYEDIANIVDSDSNPTILVGDFNNGALNTKIYDYFSKDNIIYGHSSYSSNTGYCDSIIVNGKGKISYVSDEYVNTKGDLTDHNLVITTLSVG